MQPNYNLFCNGEIIGQIYMQTGLSQKERDKIKQEWLLKSKYKQLPAHYVRMRLKRLSDCKKNE